MATSHQQPPSSVVRVWVVLITMTWVLRAARAATIAILMEMTAELATKSQVTVVDGGNRFDGYGLARALRRRTSSIPDALQNVLLSRTFTCYQMAVLLENFAQGTLPIIVLDLLSTFLDENVRLQTRQQVEDAVADGQIRELSWQAAISMALLRLFYL